MKLALIIANHPGKLTYSTYSKQQLNTEHFWAERVHTDYDNF